MSNDTHDALAWVESPLRALTAAEWAHRHRLETGGTTAIAYRISDPQVVTTSGAVAVERHITLDRTTTSTAAATICTSGCQNSSTRDARTSWPGATTCPSRKVTRPIRVRLRPSDQRP